MSDSNPDLDNIITKNLDYAWKLLDMYYSQPDILIKHQIESFNNFVDVYVPNILAKNFPNVTGFGKSKTFGPMKNHWEYECICNISDFSCARPTQIINNNIVPLYPNECRLRGCTYGAQTYVTVECLMYKWTQEGSQCYYSFKQVTPFFVLPIMLRSKYCYLNNLSEQALADIGENRFELGGYFIINGLEKVVVAQERISEDQFLVFKPNKNAKYILQGEIKSSINQLYYPIKTNRVQIVKSPVLTSVDISWFKDHLQSDIDITLLKRMYESMTETYLYFNIHGIEESIPIGVIFKALGAKDDKMIIELCGGIKYAKYIVPSLNFVHMLKINTQDEAYEYLHYVVKGGFGKQMSAEEFKKYDELTTSKINYVSVKNRFDKDILPHLVKDNAKKVMYIGYCTKRVIDTYLGIRPFNDRDHYGNKRLDLTGNLLLIFFRYRIIGIINKISDHSVQAMNNGQSSTYSDFLRDIQNNDISQKLENSLSTGNFIMSYYNDNGDVRKGIAELLSNLSYLAEISHMRKIQSPEKKNAGNLTLPRRLHESNYGYCCLNETPEGDKVGLVKFLAMTCNITSYVPESKIVMVVRRYVTMDDDLRENIQFVNNDTIVKDDYNVKIKLMINNSVVALVNKDVVQKLIEDLIILKRHNVIDPMISIYFDVYDKQIHIRTEGGRFTRPLLIVENGQILLYEKLKNDKTFHDKFMNNEYTFWDMVRPISPISQEEGLTRFNGALIEFVDANQAEWSMIAMTPSVVYNNNQAKENNKTYVNYTHCEIHPITAQGMISSLIPFSDHTPNPRNNYQCSMGKQAIGFITSSIRSRVDNSLNILAYGQHPLVQTKTAKYCVLDKLPHGTEAMLAIACYTGYNQEDSIIINKSSIDRGFFNTINYRTFAEEENKHLSYDASESFGIPPIECQRFGDKYALINKNGYPKLYNYVDMDNVIIGKYVVKREPKGVSKVTDHSVVYRLNPGYIDLIFNENTYTQFKNCQSAKSINTSDHSENLVCKVRVSQYRQPVIGDKFASRYAQKGTNSGMLIESDMPFTENGEVPDIIMNPHGLPSRATISKLIELFLGTLALFNGKYQNGTPFEDINMNNVNNMLEAYGILENRTLKNSEVTMFSGIDGRPFDVKVFYGPMYYQRLKHMVDDKIFWRGSSGPINPITRQPADGRSRSGGLRLGEMERDALVAHNVSRTLKGKFFDSSDKFKVYVDRTTGEMLIGNECQNVFIGRNGQDVRDIGHDVAEIQMPYTMKLLIQYLRACGIDIRLEA